MKTTLKNNNCSKEEAYQILREYIQSKIDLSSRKTLSESSFDNPNWAYLQAYQAGSQKALLDVLEYIPDRENK
jgi:hypothetical protein